MTALLKSLRKRVWPAEQRDIGEALRDLHSFCERLTLCEVVPATNVVWSEPFALTLGQRPRIVSLEDARVAGTLDSVATGAIDWRVDSTVSSTSSTKIRINRAATLQPGKSYDLKFLVVY